MKVKFIDYPQKNIHYGMKVGTIYNVYGISLWENKLHYLLSEPEPNWHSVELFEVTDPILPPQWFFTFTRGGKDPGLEALWGYKEMIYNDNHYVNLIELESEALEIFEKRKKEIDEYGKLRKSSDLE